MLKAIKTSCLLVPDYELILICNEVKFFNVWGQYPRNLSKLVLKESLTLLNLILIVNADLIFIVSNHPNPTQ